MAEAEKPSGGGNTLFVVIVIILLVGFWIEHGGVHRLLNQKINFGWQSTASSSSPFPFTLDFEKISPKVAPPPGPSGPKSPDPYTR